MKVYSYIYLITNTVNGKLYVGRTSDPKNRWRGHRNSKTDQLISRAIQKYGKDNFTFVLIYTSFSLEDILEKETHFIRFFGSHHKDGFGYNLTYSSLGVGKGSIPWNKGKKGVYSSETLSKMRDNHLGKTTWNKGKKTGPTPEATRQKLSIASKEARQRKFWSTKKIGDSVSTLPEGAAITN
jgi:group I intron endonuclease